MPTKTIEYYNENAKAFTAGTLSVEFQAMQNAFTNKLLKGAAILDFGCGSGRDVKSFLEKGFQVEATDGSKELCRLASAYAGISVKHQLFQSRGTAGLHRKQSAAAAHGRCSGIPDHGILPQTIYR